MNGTDLFSQEELLRYNRHIIIPEFGMEGQRRLKEAKVLVVGAGGLGSPLLLYLTAAGVGNIGIIDSDHVEESNLQRQVLFGTDLIGVSKARAARERLHALNPHIKVNAYATMLTSENALEIIREYDVVADGTDNFATRYLVNDACVMLNKPNVYASIYQFDGQVSVFNHLNSDGTRGPNYRDLFPLPPQSPLIANCSDAGVLGVLPGIVGSLQALEVIKVITGTGEPLNGRLFTFDALSFECRLFNIRKDPANPLTGNNPVIHELMDYEQFCGVEKTDEAIKSITPGQLYELSRNGSEIQIIDVREPHEFELVNIGGDLIPLSMIDDQPDRIDPDRKVVVVCRSGARSAKAIMRLQSRYGFDNLYNLQGGLLNYIKKLKLDLPVY